MSKNDRRRRNIFSTSLMIRFTQKALVVGQTFQERSFITIKMQLKKKKMKNDPKDLKFNALFSELSVQ